MEVHIFWPFWIPKTFKIHPKGYLGLKNGPILVGTYVLTNITWEPTPGVSSSVPLPLKSTPNIVSITAVTPTYFDNAVNEAFHIDNVKLCQDKNCNKRKLTSHRLLTSDELIEKELKEEEDRVLKEREKQKRKEDREIKKNEKEQKKFELQQQRLVKMVMKTKSENPNCGVQWANLYRMNDALYVIVTLTRLVLDEMNL